MKSVIHEASSLAKAIKEGWRKAGNPQEFKIKIFQDAQTSLFGLIVKRKAKIGIFFEDNVIAGHLSHQTTSSRDRNFQKERPFPNNQLRPLGNKRPSDRRYDRPRNDSRNQAPRPDFVEQRPDFKEQRTEHREIREVRPQEQHKSKVEPVVSEAKNVTDKKVINAFAKKVNE